MSDELASSKSRVVGHLIPIYLVIPTRTHDILPGLGNITHSEVPGRNLDYIPYEYIRCIELYSYIRRRNPTRIENKLLGKDY